MCGRIACTLSSEDICQACAFPKKDGQWKFPEWKDAPNGREYYPSYNIPPTNHTPVMFASKSNECQSFEDISINIQPMYWGMIPFWHKGALKEVGLSTNNAKIETILQKPMFDVPLKKGFRCVIIADGFYEWQASKSEKQPYFIYFPQHNGVAIENHDWKKQKLWDSEKGWLGPRLLTIAGIYNIWNNPEDQSELYSYSVITMEASPLINVVHERMPAILDGYEAIRNWLDSDHFSAEDALKLLRPSINLAMHPVTKKVGNSRYKSPDCNNPIDLNSQTSSKSKKFMFDWLHKSSPTEELKEIKHKRPSAIKQEDIVTENRSSPRSKKIRIDNSS